MDNRSEANQQPIIFTPNDWERCQIGLWDELGAAEAVKDRLQDRLDVLYEELHDSSVSWQNLTRQHEYAQKETEYWDTHAAFMAAGAREDALLGVLEKIEEGTASPEEALALLPPPEEETKLSKKKAAMQAEREQIMKAGEAVTALYDDFAAMSIDPLGPALGTDPRRIASGRNARQLKATKGRLSEFDDVTGHFIHVTADSHGGKSRRPGKDGKHYVGKSGKSVRKY